MAIKLPIVGTVSRDDAIAMAIVVGLTFLIMAKIANEIDDDDVKALAFKHLSFAAIASVGMGWLLRVSGVAAGVTLLGVPLTALTIGATFLAFGGADFIADFLGPDLRVWDREFRNKVEAARRDCESNAGCTYFSPRKSIGETTGQCICVKVAI